LRIKKIAERRTIWGGGRLYGANAAQTSSATMADTIEDEARDAWDLRLDGGVIDALQVEVGP